MTKGEREALLVEGLLRAPVASHGPYENGKWPGLCSEEHTSASLVGVVCTLAPGHTGAHVAHVDGKRKVIRVWTGRTVLFNDPKWEKAG